MNMYGVGYDEHGPAYPVGPVVKFKVGDRVRFTHDVSEGWWFNPGQTGVLSHIDESDGYRYHVDVDGGPSYPSYVDESHIELVSPTFSPNDRLRLKRHTATLAAGDHVIVSEATEFGVYATCINGRSHYIANDAVEHAPDCAERKVEQEFKSGDWVKCLKDNSSGCQFTAGHFYKVSAVPHTGWLSFVSDDKGSTDNGWSAEHFEPAPYVQEPKPSMGVAEFEARLSDGFTTAIGGTPRPCIVALMSNGQPRPSQWPHVHPSVQEATAEAERLAKNNPGQEFAVFQRVTARVCEVSYEMKEVA